METNKNLQTDIVFLHKGCGGEIVTRSCAWDDMVNVCSDCDKHEHMDGFEIENKIFIDHCMHCEEPIYEEDDNCRRGSSGDFHWHEGCRQ